MTKAVRIAAEDAGEGARALRVLQQLAERELDARDFLERAAGEPSSAPAESSEPPADEVQAVDRFVRLRARNFAMMQRRGIDVWGWRAMADDGEEATVHQLLSELVAEDVAALAQLRAARAAGGG